MAKTKKAACEASASPLDTGQYPPAIPLLSVEGTAAECGRQLGYLWAEPLRLTASQPGRSAKPWWKHKPYLRLLERYAPHLPDLFRGMAQSAGLSEDQIGTRAPAEGGGCTSFAIAPSASAGRQPISGQTKDTPIHRLFQFQVLRVKMSDAPSLMTLTYPGWLFGHGFVEGRCAIYRNALYGGSPRRGLPHTVWGLLSLHCKSVDDAMKLAADHGCDMGSHSTIADAQGGIVGVEFTEAGATFLRPRGGLYAHANAVCGSAKTQKLETCGEVFVREDSLLRQDRLRQRLEPDVGRLTAPLVFSALVDHHGHPRGMCRHQGAEASTTAVVISEPTRGLMHVCRGRPCENFPVTYRL